MSSSVTMKSTNTWDKISDCFFEEHNLTEHQIDSYNNFIQMKLGEIIKRSEIVFKKLEKQKTCKITFDNIFLKKPQIVEPSGIIKKLKPSECRVRNLTYSGDLMLDVREDIIEDGKVVETIHHSDIFIGSIPIMVKSDWCHLTGLTLAEIYSEKEDPYDFGGYFIINGIEKVLVSQDRMAHNENFIFKCKDHTKQKTTNNNPGKKNTKKRALVYDWVAEVRSYSEYIEPNISTTVLKLTKQQLELCEDARIYVDVPTLTDDIPLPVLFMALGVLSKDEMLHYICNSDDTEMVQLLKPSLHFPNSTTQEQAIQYISNYVTISQQGQDKQKQTRLILKRKFFQNVIDMRLKRYYLGYITHQLLSTVLGRRNPDDRDHYAKKRVDTAGGLLTNLFKSTWKRICRDIKTVLEKKRGISIRSVFHSRITPLLKKAFATGNWTGTKIVKNTKVGICQMLNNLNYVSRLSNIRRVKTPAEKNNKIVKPRHAHSSHFYYICLAETPEGQETGLLRNLAMLTTITTGSSEKPIIDWIAMLGETLLEHIDYSDNITDIQTCTKILINGQWVAITKRPGIIVDKLRHLRREHKISTEVSISLTKEGIRIYTDEGRLIAPYIVVNNGTLPTLPETYDWHSLIEEGVIEYLDPAEAETLYISCYPWKLDAEHTHSIIDPAYIFGISASTVPFANHDQSPRVIYQSSMGKQALGMCAINYLHRYDSSNHVMTYGQRPLLETNVMRRIFETRMTAQKKELLQNPLQHTMSINGNNLIVAIASYTGFNQEDSVIINKSSLDNGILRSINYSTYTSSNKKKGNLNSEICKPHELNVRETRLIGYSKLDEDGIPYENTPLTKKDIVIGQVNSFQQHAKDASTIVKINGMDDHSVLEQFLPNGQHGYFADHGYVSVDRSILTLNEDSFKSVSVRTRQNRIPVIGDKVASRHAQKGIIGMILPHEDMPYSMDSGIIPDLIMNPNAMPSRMTTGQTLECLLSKLCCLDAQVGDCTPFRTVSLDSIGDALEQHGFNRHGNEKMINGMTGEVMDCEIFMGPTYYQRLKHMVSDKIHSRTQNGPREILTRQPVEGRKKAGGFRVGEMETWCGISHGVSNFLIDRLVNNSDKYEMYVCNDCGNTAIANLDNKNFECKRCLQTNRISKIKIPYAFKLLQQELMATGIGMWYEVDTSDE